MQEIGGNVNEIARIKLMQYARTKFARKDKNVI